MAVPGPEASWGQHVLGPVWVSEDPCGCQVRLTGVRGRPLCLDQGHTGFVSYPPVGPPALQTLLPANPQPAGLAALKWPPAPFLTQLVLSEVLT